jgi:hypothetical protein
MAMQTSPFAAALYTRDQRKPENILFTPKKILWGKRRNPCRAITWASVKSDKNRSSTFPLRSVILGDVWVK